jgi:probable rRNA maturation factor
MRRSREGGLRVRVSDARGRTVRAGGLSAWLRRVAPLSASGTVNVALVTDARMRVLNRRYRRKDYATDVLSFPAGPATRLRGLRPLRRGRPSHQRPAFAGPACVGAASPATIPCLGDIVIATGVAGRQAREAGHREPTELRILALHGLLHLLGYDHEQDDGRMGRVERRLRRKGGLPEGLIERG